MDRLSLRTKKSPTPLSVWGATLLFVLISLGGWSFEKIGRYVLYGSTDDRGFLTLPLCPIYGTCVLLIGILFGSPQAPSRLFSRLCRPLGSFPSRWGAVCRWLLYFLAVTGLSTAVELVVGLLFQQLGIPLWDYSERVGNFMGVICPSFSLLWGILLTVLMGLLWDRLCSEVAKIPVRVQRVAAIGMTVLIGADFLLNCFFVVFHGERFWFL
ncbi:MAG: putative ABC transporter permease [Clostridia bacterium]|nr:putative ABC transporter permease [Clostridia bacterium]